MKLALIQIKKHPFGTNYRVYKIDGGNMSEAESIITEKLALEFDKNYITYQYKDIVDIYRSCQRYVVVSDDELTLFLLKYSQLISEFDSDKYDISIGILEEQIVINFISADPWVLKKVGKKG